MFSQSKSSGGRIVPKPMTAVEKAKLLKRQQQIAAQQEAAWHNRPSDKIESVTAFAVAEAECPECGDNHEIVSMPMDAVGRVIQCRCGCKFRIGDVR